jgi:hypothetical protein
MSFLLYASYYDSQRHIYFGIIIIVFSESSFQHQLFQQSELSVFAAISSACFVLSRMSVQ